MLQQYSIVDNDYLIEIDRMSLSNKGNELVEKSCTCWFDYEIEAKKVAECSDLKWKLRFSKNHQLVNKLLQCRNAIVALQISNLVPNCIHTTSRP